MSTARCVPERTGQLCFSMTGATSEHEVHWNTTRTQQGFPTKCTCRSCSFIFIPFHSHYYGPLCKLSHGSVGCQTKIMAVMKSTSRLDTSGLAKTSIVKRLCLQKISGLNITQFPGGRALESLMSWAFRGAKGGLVAPFAGASGARCPGKSAGVAWCFAVWEPCHPKTSRERSGQRTTELKDAERIYR